MSEFGFLVKDGSPENKGYFRKLTRLIGLKIINLGETKFPIVRPKRLGSITLEGASITPSGFSMDIGGLSPLGRPGIFELIGTPNELAEFQTEDWLCKHEAEIILVNAMTRPSLLMGDRGLFEEYQAHLHEVLDDKIGPLQLTKILNAEHREQVRQKRALELMKGYVTEFKPNLDQDKIVLRGFDVKRELYRLPHSVINALALYYAIPENNTLEQLETLTQMRVFPPQGSSQLKKLLTQVLNWRMQTHLFYQNEKEIFYFTKGEEDLSAKGLFLITKEIQEALRECYRTLYPLHEAALSFAQGDKNAFANSSLYNAELEHVREYEDDPLVYQEAAMTYMQVVALDPENLDALDQLQKIKLTLGEAKQALDLNLERLSILKKAHRDELHPDIADCKNCIGIALGELGRNEEALSDFMQALALRKKIFGEEHPYVAISLNYIGTTLTKLERHEDALSYQVQVLELFKKIFGEQHLYVAKSLSYVSFSLGKLGRHEEALTYQMEALELRRKIVSVHGVGGAIENDEIK